MWKFCKDAIFFVLLSLEGQVVDFKILHVRVAALSGRLCL